MRRTLLLMGALITAGCGVNAAERNNAGNALYDAGAYTEALIAYQVAQVAEPDRAEPYINAANVYAQMGRLAEAQAAVEQATKTANISMAAQAYYNLGNAYFEMQLFEQAAEAYQETLLLTPDDQDARYNLELALKRVLPPTEVASPEFQEPDVITTQTNDAGENSDLSTPSPQPATVTPETEATPVGVLSPENGGEMSADEATRLLDAVQQNQTVLSGVLQGTSVPESAPEKDW